MTTSLSRDQAAAVALDVFYGPMASCPQGVKVILLGAGGVAVIGTCRRGDDFWQGWAPLPRLRCERARKIITTTENYLDGK